MADRHRHRVAGLAAAAALLAFGALAACDVDDAQVQLCRHLISAFEDEPGQVTIERVANHPNAEHGVIIDYRVAGEPHEVASAAGTMTEAPMHWISCRFEPEPSAWFGDATRLVEVASDRTGTLSGIDLQMLKIWLRIARG